MQKILVRTGVILVLAAFLIVPVMLHFAQKRHNQLPFAIAEVYPESEPIVNGEVFASVLAVLMEHELDSPTGWRPNDLFLWGPALWADNKANRQLGIIQAVRESTRVFRDNLTKVSATEYDSNLVDADTKFRNDEHKFWFPAAETRFDEGVAALRKYEAGLKTTPPTSKPINRRNVELIRLFTAWTDLLGGAHANLYKEEEAGSEGSSVSFWKTDDYFYHAQGFAHVMHHLLLAVQREYAAELHGRQTVLELMAQVSNSLERAASVKPLVVLDGSPAGLFANHRRNLDVYLVDARQLIFSIREELEK
ncbi:MAG: DUF2333 family protein [Proteobacteria bacterium]|nr:DUF2333 family protein [Pseudomonadota bacterium]